jgi:hypothetical protein
MFSKDLIPAERPLPSGSAHERQLRLQEHVGRSLRSTGRRRRAVHATIVAAAASTVLVAGTAAAYVAFREASTPVVDQTRCYTRASLAGGDGFAGTTVGKARPAAGQRLDEAAVELCAPLWAQGILRLGSTQIGAPGAPAQPVPELTACVLDSGVAAVFPGPSDVCARLGLPRLTS